MDPSLPGLFSFDGGLTLLAPLVAVAFALATRRVLPALGLAIAVGAWVAADGGPVAAVALGGRLGWSVVTDPDKLTVAGFSILVAAAVGVMGRSGGTRGLVAWVERWARGRRGAMVSSWIAGAVVFFDDYANCLVVGSAMGPLCDRNGVSRAKLAYIVDATAAPVASLAVVSTWVGYEVGLLRDALTAAGSTSLEAFPLFLAALPYRFYCLLTLAFVGAVAFTGRDFGPMRHAEARARPVAGDGAAPAGGSRGWLAAVPVAVLVGATFALLLWDGSRSLGAEAAQARLFEILGAADPFRSMLYGAGLCWTVAAGAALGWGGLGPRQIAEASWTAARAVAHALAVLYLAWVLGGVIQEGGAAAWLAQVLGDRLPPELLPVVVFLLASATSFATGTSFFTMGALIPLAVPLAIQLGGDAAVPIVLATTAAVLDGAVLGDHASPISDTTILSSLGSGCDVVTHVRTQLPYVGVVGLLAVVFGSLPAAFGASPWLLTGLGAVAAWGVVRALGRPPDPA